MRAMADHHKAPPSYESGQFSRSSTTLVPSDSPKVPLAQHNGQQPGLLTASNSFTRLSPGADADPYVRRVKSSVNLSHRSGSDLDAGPSFDGPRTAAQPPPAGTKAVLKQALEEAQFFAGGILSRAVESTKHYSIIRHSFAIQKGFSGKTGMALKARLGGGVDGWINVTPASAASASQLPPNDERAFQRDLKRFAEKASGRLRKHLPRETLVVRIPAGASDGYYRLVLCEGADPGKRHTWRGPPLHPLEVGVKVGSVIATNTVLRYVAPVTGIVGSRVAKYGSKMKLAKKGASMAYQQHDEQWRNIRQQKHNQLLAADAGLLSTGDPSIVCAIGSEMGPEPPFPTRFTGVVVKGTGLSRERYGVPTANLSGLPEEIKASFKGVFVAWARVQPKKDLNVTNEWCEAVVTVAPLMHGPVGAVRKTKAAVHFLNDFEVDFFEAKVDVLLMGFIRQATMLPNEPSDALDSAMLDALLQDVIVSVASLRREHWGHEDALQRLKTVESEKSFSSKLMDVRDKVQNNLERVPLHLAGVRSESDQFRDAVYGAGDCT
ncbi:unnamed protein product [Parascedosporium putredinis]|uniref:Riboflavin kinase n=1 Tax=Parascedosporium putredinis TaxID=1442378 RepID=A0A9P1M979_9PEZI|nr:unnamed protein product [Parascedosporium putredinis]CAI7990295.1 unnamed protein product [Parascedosporium putredinis]